MNNGHKESYNSEEDRNQEYKATGASENRSKEALSPKNYKNDDLGVFVATGRCLEVLMGATFQIAG